MRKTKIICTIGPASEHEDVLTRMIKAGMDVARLNFSHGSHEEHQGKIDLIHKADDDELAGISAKLNRIQQKCSRCTGAFFVVYFCLNDKNGVLFALGCI